MPNVTSVNRAGPEPAYHIAITAIWHKADILTVRFFRHGQTIVARQIAGFLLAHTAKRKPQIGQLFRRCGKQKIGLVFARISAAPQRQPAMCRKALHIMASGQTIGAKIARCCQQISKFYRLVAPHTGDRRFAAQIAVGKILHHLILKAAFIIQHIMRDTETRRDAPRVMYINTRTTGTFGLHRHTMIIQL